MTMEASTPACAATARMVVCSYPRPANVALAASRMARRVPSERGPPMPSTGPAWPAAGPAACLLSVTEPTLLFANGCWPTFVDNVDNCAYFCANNRWHFEGERRWRQGARTTAAGFRSRIGRSRASSWRARRSPRCSSRWPAAPITRPDRMTFRSASSARPTPPAESSTRWTAPCRGRSTGGATPARPPRGPGSRTGSKLVVTDVVPPLPGDTQALSSFFLLLGALIPSVAAGSGSALAFRKARPALGIAAAVAVGVAGLGNFPAIAGVTALFSLAVAAPTAVLARIRPPLVGLAVLLFIVAGIPDSGGPANLAGFSAAGFRAFDSVLPLGVAGSVMRNVVYFGGHSTALHLWVLAAWAVAGLAGLVVLTTRRRAVPAGTAAAVAPAGVPAGAHAAPRHARPESADAPGAPDFGGVEPITLVVGFDDSAPARRALTWGADLMRARAGTLHVVYADHPLIDSDLTGLRRPVMDEARDDRAATVARVAAEIAAAAGVPYTFERRQESPADAMLSPPTPSAAPHPASEPVLVTGRSHHAPHRILGSVPVDLLRESPYPVLTIS